MRGQVSHDCAPPVYPCSNTIIMFSISYYIAMYNAKDYGIVIVTLKLQLTLTVTVVRHGKIEIKNV